MKITQSLLDFPACEECASGDHHARLAGLCGAYRNLIYFHEVDRGGHFAAWEQPELFVDQVRRAFRAMR